MEAEGAAVVDARLILTMNVTNAAVVVTMHMTAVVVAVEGLCKFCLTQL